MLICTATVAEDKTFSKVLFIEWVPDDFCRLVGTEGNLLETEM